MRNFRVMLLALVVLVAGCSDAPVLTISNRSGVTISNVVVSGSGFSEQVGNIAPGADSKLTVHPTGESGVRLVFDAQGQHIDSGEKDYFEASGGYHVLVVVTQDMKVVVQSQLPKY